jgi:hypothetical protein
MREEGVRTHVFVKRHSDNAIEHAIKHAHSLKAQKHRQKTKQPLTKSLSSMSFGKKKSSNSESRVIRDNSGSVKKVENMCANGSGGVNAVCDLHFVVLYISGERYGLVETYYESTSGMWSIRRIVQYKDIYMRKL